MTKPAVRSTSGEKHTIVVRPLVAASARTTRCTLLVPWRLRRCRAMRRQLRAMGIFVDVGTAAALGAGTRTSRIPSFRPLGAPEVRVLLMWPETRAEAWSSSAVVGTPTGDGRLSVRRGPMGSGCRPAKAWRAVCSARAGICSRGVPAFNARRTARATQGRSTRPGAAGSRRPCGESATSARRAPRRCDHGSILWVRSWRDPTPREGTPLVTDLFATAAQSTVCVIVIGPSPARFAVDGCSGLEVEQGGFGPSREVPFDPACRRAAAGGAPAPQPQTRSSARPPGVGRPG